VDRATLVRRNPEMGGLTKRQRDSSVVADAAPAVDVVALCLDVALCQAIHGAVGAQNSVWNARSPEESVDLLMSGHCGVLFIDMGAVPAQPASLVQQITDQFPDVVIVVAGRRDDQKLLAQQISDGLVYRFMHKPLSPKRAEMFLNAAMRSHLERRGGRPAMQLLPALEEPRQRPDALKWVFVGSGLLLFLLLVGAALTERYGSSREPGATTPKLAARSARTPAAPLADPVLSAARAAYAAGRYESPPGRNALDLYAEVLSSRPDSAEARKGLDDTTQRLLAAAEAAMIAGDHAEAERVVERMLAADPGNLGAQALRARLAPPVEVAVPLPPPPPESPQPEAAPPEAPSTRNKVPADPLLRPDPGPRGMPGMSTARAVYPRKPTAPRSSGQVAGRTAPRAVPALPIARSFESAPAPPVESPVALAPRRLQPVSTPEPIYPAQALRDRTEGWVEIEYTVDENGATRDLATTASEPHGVFDEAAMNAVASWRYLPGVVNGRPVPQRTSVTLHFNVAE
jgi:TonB family protein